MSPSIARNSFARLVSDGGHLVIGFVSGVITARWFEPSGKGAYAALVSLLSIFAHASSLGLGDASIVLLGRGEVSMRRIVSSILIPVSLASCAGAFGLALVADIQLADQGPTLGRAVLIAAATVPILSLSYTLGFLLQAHERIVEWSQIRVLVQAITLAGIVALVILVPLHITGGMVAAALGPATGLMVTAILVRRMGVGLRPTWDRSLIWKALKLGVPIEIAQGFLILAARVDVLFVYSLAGRADAGRYSVALTMGQLVTFASLALSFALFPRIARIGEAEGFALVAKASRVGLVTSLVSGVILLIAIPVIVPVAFGPDYRGSVAPALLLLVGGVLWAEQSLLARARTARGRTRLQVAAYGSTLVTMVVLDLLLIPTWGVMGAAAGSAVAPAAGIAICIAAYSRSASLVGLGIRDFLPGREDVVFLVGSVAGAIETRRPGR